MSPKILIICPDNRKQSQTGGAAAPGLEMSEGRTESSSWSRVDEAGRAMDCIGHVFKKANLFTDPEMQVIYKNIRKYR